MVDHAGQLAHGLETPAAYLLPLKARHAGGHVGADSRWETSAWPLKREQLFLLAGDSAAGYRLPLASLPKAIGGVDALIKSLTAKNGGAK